MIVAEIEQRLTKEIIPAWEKELGEALTPKLKQVVRVLYVVQIQTHLPRAKKRRGPKGHDRRLLARAFVVKALYNAPFTRTLIEMLHTQPMLRRLIGWRKRADIPSEPTFSRAFAAFAKMNLGEVVHQALVQTYIAERLVGHLCRDSTEISVREKALRKPRKPKLQKRPRGRPKTGSAPRVPASCVPKSKRLPKQRQQSVEQALRELPTRCDIGCKRDSNGFVHHWKGYKAHIDTADGGLPVSVVTTSASLHDSQVAIPMLRQSAKRVTSLYDLMDTAYDAKDIREVSLELGHQPIIDRNRRGGQAPPPMDPATARRYQQRTVSERVNSRLKDEFGGRQVRVKGHSKVHMHIMFGILALFADQLFQMLKW
jgi:hypothetical protein